MEPPERIRILELAFDVAHHKLPTSANTTTESIDAWHKLFDHAHKAILKTVLGN